MPLGATLLVTGLFAATAVALSACGAHRAPSDPGPRGTLRFDCAPEDTVVEVDETVLGPAAMFEERGLLLVPGTHRVILRAKDHFSEYLQIELARDEMKLLVVTLRPIPE